MHTGGNKLNSNLNIAGLFLQEIYTSTETSWACVRVISRVHHTRQGVGGSVETK